MSMQHSVRSVSLAADSAGGGRGLPRQDRTGPARRTSRHTAAGREAREGGVADRPRRADRESGGGYFSIEEPPPLEAPAGIAEITGWELAAGMWRDHRPEQLLGVDCASCKQSWPCDAWELADDIITQCCEAAQRAAVSGG
ncbi:hypothetical protein [Glycomyces xiaoerkulensis]|uniref:hypothetical protein n=1 Tax=Glycomyces xiaoerkulensis TaxID=2038139 RepID=UPI0012FFD930|nr:hypothetical protein [Glycomyces xiaoerkulensis]